MSKSRILLALDDHIFKLEAFDQREQDLKDRVYEKMHSRIEFDPATECCIYTGSWEANGQAKMRVNNRIYCVSRLAAWVFYEGFQLWGNNRAVRSCESPACCNPEHIVAVRGLREALAAQREAGRFGDGPAVRLTRSQAAEMRALAAGGVLPPELAQRFRVRVPAVRAVLLNRTWTIPVETKL